MALLVTEHRGTAHELHGLAMPTEATEPALWVMRPTGPSLVMGSAQRADQFDQVQLGADGVALAGRRTGGGAVFINPSSTVWIDVVAPVGSGLYDGELAKNFVVVGRRWQEALAEVGIDADVATAASARTEASTLACWAGVGWGELTVGDVKVVGLSQRRTRWGARVQAMAVLDGSAGRVGRYFASEQDRLVATDSIAPASFAPAVEPTALETAVIEVFQRYVGG